MILANITELSLYGVYDRGKANQERIVIYVNDPIVNLGQFGLMLGIKGPNESALPINDNLFWFGEGYVKRGDWLFIYTGPGEFRKSTIPNSDSIIYTAYWKRKLTILGDLTIVPILFRIDAVITSSPEWGTLIENKK